MTVRKEWEFDFYEDTWSGGKDTIDSLTSEQVDYLEQMLDDYFADQGEIPTDTEVNDFLWFERDTIAEWLGFKDFDQLDLYNKHSDETFYTKDDDGDLYTRDDVETAYEEALENEEFDEDDYDGWEDWAEAEGYEEFEPND